MIQKFRDHMPPILLNLYQRRMDDKDAVITIEEFREANRQIEEDLTILVARLEMLKDAHALLKALIEEKKML